MTTKRSYIFKQTCTLKLQVCLSMYDPLVDTGRQRVNNNDTTISIDFFLFFETIIQSISFISDCELVITSWVVSLRIDDQ